MKLLLYYIMLYYIKLCRYVFNLYLFLAEINIDIVQIVLFTILDETKNELFLPFLSNFLILLIYLLYS